MTRVSVLQLDTHFPRIPGDIACAATYRAEPELIRIPNAAVANIVRADPQNIDIEPFLRAAQFSVGDVVTTSCGFLAPLETAIARELDRPFLASSLNALAEFEGQTVQVMTFDETALGPAHFQAGMDIPGIFGVGASSHLYAVIAGDLPELDAEKAEREVVAQALAQVRAGCDVLVLECTNLPPYKNALRRALPCPTYDILDRIEAVAPSSIRPAHL